MTQPPRLRWVRVDPCFLRIFVLQPGLTPLGDDPEWLKITRFYPEMSLNGGQYPVGVFPGCNTKALIFGGFKTKESHKDQNAKRLVECGNDHRCVV